MRRLDLLVHSAKRCSPSLTRNGACTPPNSELGTVQEQQKRLGVDKHGTVLPCEGNGAEPETESLLGDMGADTSADLLGGLLGSPAPPTTMSPSGGSSSSLLGDLLGGGALTTDDQGTHFPCHCVTAPLSPHPPYPHQCTATPYASVPLQPLVHVVFTSTPSVEVKLPCLNYGLKSLSDGCPQRSSLQSCRAWLTPTLCVHPCPCHAACATGTTGGGDMLGSLDGLLTITKATPAMIAATPTLLSTGGGDLMGGLDMLGSPASAAGDSTASLLGDLLGGGAATDTTPPAEATEPVRSGCYVPYAVCPMPCVQSRGSCTSLLRTKLLFESRRYWCVCVLGDVE